MRTCCLLVFSGCLSASVSQFDVRADACGGWTAEIDATGFGDQLVLEVNGSVAQTWALNGPSHYVATGVGAPGTALNFRVVADAASISKQVVVPPAAISGTFDVPSTLPSNAVGKITGRVSSNCAIPVGQWSAKATPGTWVVTNQPILPDGTFEIPLPSLSEGTYQIEVELYLPSGKMVLPPKSVVILGPVADGDGDGFEPPSDCDDRNPEINPFAGEQPTANGVDDNCDGRIDEGTSKFDDDGDGLTEERGDCDDRDPGRKPGAAEVADCRDQNCDGIVDEGVQLKATDDSYEPNDDVKQARDLNTSGRRSFSEVLRWTTRNTKDEEWFQFYSQDGTWDDWGIDVTLDQMAEGAVYEVEVFADRGPALVSERIDQEGHSAAVRGKGLRDDSGQYWVRIKPVNVPAWCPVQVKVVSR